MFFPLCRRLWAVCLSQNLDCLPCEFHAILILSPACCRLAPLLGLCALWCICLSAVTHPRGLDATAGPFHLFSPPSPPLPASSVDNAVMGSALCPALTAELCPDSVTGFTAQRPKIVNLLSKSFLPCQITNGFLLTIIWICRSLELHNLKTVSGQEKYRWIYAFQECDCSYASWLWYSKEIN